MGAKSSKILKSLLWKFLEKCSVQVTTLIVTIVLARILTPNEFGVIAIIVIFINLANVIVEGGLTAALIQKKDADNRDFSTIFIVSLILSFVVYVLLYLSAPLISRFYKNHELIDVIRVLALMLVPCAINSVQKAYISKFMLFGKMFICAFLSVVISGIIGVILANKGYGVWSLVAQTLLNQIIVTILLFIFIKWRPKLIFDFGRFKLLFDFGWKIFVANFIIALYEDIRGLLIGKFYQPSALAFFDRGKQFPSLIMGNINTSIQTVLFPAFSAEQENKLKVKKMMKAATQVSCFIVFPLLMFLFISADPLVRLVLTDKWLPAVPFIRIFSVALILMPIQSSNMIAIKSLGYSNLTLKLEIVKKVIELIILIISFQFDVYMVAVGIIIYNLISLFVNLHPARKLVDYPTTEQILDILPTLFVSFLASFVSYWIGYINFSPIFILLGQGIIGAAIYMFLSYKMKLEALSTLTSAIKNLKK